MRAADGRRALRRGIALGLTAGLVSVTVSACGSSSVKPTAATASVVSAPVRVAHTRLGAVGYRVVGSGPPLIWIMGYGWTMEDWDPRLVHALAQHNRVAMFDNSGVGRTQQLPAPLTIDAMADQTSALIDTLGLGRPNVLGWSMGGMIAQALAVLHPAQVRRLVLCATYPGTGAAVVPSATARQAGSDMKGAQSIAAADWWAGTDAAGREIARISMPTLIADGVADQLVPAANDHILARLIPGARLVLYPDAGHGFLFQEGTPFASRVESFLTGHPSG
jgi:pimeloyl-ACP methyl ester carboxylesterase